MTNRRRAIIAASCTWQIVNGVLYVYSDDAYPERLPDEFSPRFPWRYSDEITGVVIGGDVTRAYTGAFALLNNLVSVVINDGVVNIGGMSFSDCPNLRTVTLPASITLISAGVFLRCTSIENFTFNGTIAQWNAIMKSSSWCRDSNYFLIHCTDGDVPNRTWDIIDGVLYVYHQNAMDDSLDAIPWASDKNSITSVVMSNSITRIRDNAFAECPNLESVSYGNGLTEIGQSAFYTCPSLTNISLPNGITTIGDSAFGSCLYIENFTYNGTTAQWNAIIKDNMWGVHCNYFLVHCTDGDVPNIEWKLASGILNVYAQEPLNIGVGVVVPWENEKDTITDVIISDGVTDITANVFAEYQNMSLLTMFNGVTTIWSGAFADCTSLETVILPASITDIYSGVFSGCMSISHFGYSGTIAQWNAINKRTNWRHNSSITTVRCADGYVTL